MNGRTETDEGIDNKLSLHYYGRMLFIRQLGDKLKQTALQQTDNDVRVLSILSGGKHGSYTDVTDLDLKRNFSLPNAANAAGFYNDLALDHLAREDAYLATADSAAGDKRGISFIHACPGFVKTPWGKDFPWYAFVPVLPEWLSGVSGCVCTSVSLLFRTHGGRTINLRHSTADSIHQVLCTR
jgi:hypothetical protein